MPVMALATLCEGMTMKHFLFITSAIAVGVILAKTVKTYTNL